MKALRIHFLIVLAAMCLALGFNYGCGVDAHADGGEADVEMGVGCGGAGLEIGVDGPDVEIELGAGCVGCECVDCRFTDCCGMDVDVDVDVDYDCCCVDSDC